MKIVGIEPDDKNMIKQCARILMDAFRENWPGAWNDMDSALDEVEEALRKGRIAKAAVDENGNILGWIGGIPKYRGNVWELHPLAVDPKARGKGVGRKLVGNFEEEVRRRGGLTVWLGTDDEDDMTSLSGADLYEDTWERVRNIRNFKNHPFGFYEKLGYKIVGVLPDADGPGRPDIFMAKRIERNGNDQG